MRFDTLYVCFAVLVICNRIVAADAPTFTSGPVVDHRNAYAGQTLTFSATATTSNGQAAVYTWDFKDGSSGNGTSVTHIFATPGAYAVVVTASDGTLTTTAPIGVNIVAPPFGTGLDSDGDGFADEFEASAGTDPHDLHSTPLNGASASNSSFAGLVLGKVNIKCTVGAKPSFKLTSSGNLLFATPLTAPVSPQKVHLVIEAPTPIPSIGFSYDLDAKGNAPRSETGSATFKGVHQPKPASGRSFGQQPAVQYKIEGIRFDKLLFENNLGWIIGLTEYNPPERSTARATSKTMVPLNLYVTYGGKVHMGVLNGLVKKDSKGNCTLTTTK